MQNLHSVLVMSKRRKWFLLLCTLVAILLVTLLFTDSPRHEGPVCKGRHLSEWVQLIGYFGNLSGSEYFDAEDAITEVGTNAFPFLLKWLQHEDTHFRYKLLRRFEFMIPKQTFANLTTSPRQARADGADRAIMILRDQVTPELVSELASLMNNPATPETANRVAQILRGIGPAGRPALAAVLQDSQHPARHAALLSLYVDQYARDPQPYSGVFMPGLIQYATDTNPPSFLAFVTPLLLKLGVSAAEYVPILATNLLHSDAGVRRCAVLTLGRLGEPASETLPTLTNLLSDSDLSVRIQATNTVQRLTRAADPTAGSK